MTDIMAWNFVVSDKNIAWPLGLHYNHFVSLPIRPSVS